MTPLRPDSLANRYKVYMVIIILTGYANYEMIYWYLIGIDIVIN